MVRAREAVDAAVLAAAIGIDRAVERDVRRFVAGDDNARSLERDLGAKRLDLARLQAGLAFVFDVDGPVGTIVNEAPTHVALKATFRGRAAHAGIEPERGVSAIVAAATVCESDESKRVGDIMAAGAEGVVG